MIKSKKAILNLASHPLRNRRFLYLLLSVLGIFLILVSFLASKTFLEYRHKVLGIRALIKSTDQSIKKLEREEKELTARVKDAVKRNKEKVDLANSIILRKSFSWVEFFSDLEKSLPDSSYIVSLVPALQEDSSLQLKLKVVSPDLKELLKFLNNLKALKFVQMRIISEGENERGMLISEVSLTHERAD
jgi:cell division protein FtsB